MQSEMRILKKPAAIGICALSAACIGGLLWIWSSGSAETQEEERYKDADVRMSVMAAQVNLWYQTIKGIRQRAEEPVGELGRLLNIATVQNYFPLYLEQRRIDEINQSHLRTARLAFADLTEEDRASVFRFENEDGYNAMLETGMIESFGFRHDDVKTLKAFQELRMNYFEFLGEYGDSSIRANQGRF